MFFRKLFTLSTLVSFFIYAFIADDTDIKTITFKLEKFRKNYPQEKVHLHLDKPYYSIGDTIYFAAYVVNAEKNTPSVISNILYVDLINDSGYVSLTLKLYVTDGVALGTINIADSLQEGNYRIRAYTNWMRNFDDAFFFDKIIAIGNGFNNQLVATSSFQPGNAGNKNNDSVSVQFNSLNNTPVEYKEVTYSVVVNKKEKAKGKIVTDSKGKLHISLADMHLQHDQTVLLLTHIKLNNKIITKEIKINISAARNTIHFFPEGGQMVAGLSSITGFKAMSADGLGTDVSGEIRDDSTNEIIAIKSGFAGIGSFQFTPLSNHSYHAFIQYKDGSEETVALPTADAYGYVLSINNTNADTISLNINSKQLEPADKIIIVGQTNNRIQYAATLSLINGSAHISLSKKKLPTGIIQFTLFDPALHPIAERLAFINHNDTLKISISLDKSSYNKRGKTKMLLTVKDEKGNPVNGTFSLAVTDASTVTATNNEENILSDLLLTSDIKGYIENPGYYFTDISDEKVNALDNLLLTQGWRRFTWQDILADKYPDIDFTKEKSLSINGKVVSAKGVPVPGKDIILLSKKGQGFILDTVTGSNGDFRFDELSFDDDYPFVLQADDKDLKIILKDFNPPSAINNKNRPEMQQLQTNVMVPYLTQSNQQYDELRKHGLLQSQHQLKDVVVTTAQQTKVQQAVAPSYNLNGPGNADQIFTYEDLRNCHDLGICLQGKITGVFFKMVVEDPAARVKVWHLLPFTGSGMGKPMMVVLDGAYLTAGQHTLDMRNITAQNIQSIEVLRSGGYLSTYGMSGSGGVLVITSKQGGTDYNANTIQQEPPSQNTAFTTAKGYSVCRQFYMPDYSDPAISNSSIPDLRSTIFWKSNIITDDDGKATIEWYNADNAGDCNIVIEGLSMEGKLGHASFAYRIN